MAQRSPETPIGTSGRNRAETIPKAQSISFTRLDPKALMRPRKRRREEGRVKRKREVTKNAAEAESGDGATGRRTSLSGHIAVSSIMREIAIGRGLFDGMILMILRAGEYPSHQGHQHTSPHRQQQASPISKYSNLFIFHSTRLSSSSP